MAGSGMASSGMASSGSEWLVGGVAMGLACWIGACAVMRSERLFRLRSVDRLRQHFGDRVATILLLLVAACLVALAAMILAGVRPDYAIPAK